MKKQFLQLIIRVIANAVGIYIAAKLMSKISYGNTTVDLFVSALILALVNAVIRPLVVILSLPAYLVTLGLFSLFVNAFMLYLVDFLYGPFSVAGLFTPVLAGIIIGLINYSLTRFFDSFTKKEV
jgi:putative membrane protein